MAATRADASGVHSPSIHEAVTDKQAQFSAVFGTDLAESAATPQSQLVGIMAVADVEGGETAVAVANGQSLDHATGRQLDDIGSQRQVFRRGATRTIVDATLTGVAATTVPAGSRARTTAGDEFTLAAAVTVTPDGVTATFNAVETGAVPADANTLTEIVSVIAGWETVNNPTAGTVGVLTETDAAYRERVRLGAAHQAIGPLAALTSAVVQAGSTRYRIEPNNTHDPITKQQWRIEPHGILAIIEGGTAADIRRAIETHRGMGASTTVGIVGGTPKETALNDVSDGTVTFGGTAYTGLDLSDASTPAAKAAALTALLAAAATPVTVISVDGIYVAVYGWHPDESPAFASGTVVDAFGFDPNSATAPTGPFIRPRTRALTVKVSVIRASGFPADGLNQMRQAITNRVNAYGIGEQLWANDLLVAIEAIAGTRVTTLTVQHASADVSGIDPPLDAVWTLAADDLTITIT